MLTDDQLKQNVKRNLKRLMSDRGITAYRLAKLVDEPMNSIYRAVRGENVTSVVTLARIASQLKTTVDDIIRG